MPDRNGVMDESEFIAELRKATRDLKLSWWLGPDGSIRTHRHFTQKACFCPITAVYLNMYGTTAALADVQPAAWALGLKRPAYSKILHAADNLDHDQELRAHLLRACGIVK